MTQLVIRIGSYLSLLVTGIVTCPAQLFQSSGRGEPEITWFIGPQSPLVIMPASFITTDVVEKASWSSDGRRLLLVTHEPEVKPGSDIESSLTAPHPTPFGRLQTIAVWNADTRAKIIVWSSTPDRSYVADAQWLAGSHRLLATIGGIIKLPSATEPAKLGSSLLSANGDTGQWHFSESLQGFPGLISIEPSPLKPLAIVVLEPESDAIPLGQDGAIAGGKREQDLPIVNMLFIGEDGRPIFSFKERGFCTGDWSVDGSKYFVDSLNFGKDRKIKHSWRQASSDPAEPVLATPPVLFKKQPNPNRLLVNTLPLNTKLHGKAVAFEATYLSSPVPTKRPDALLGVEIQVLGGLAPGDRYFAYSEGGAFKVRAIVKPSDELWGLIRKAERTKLLSQAKQVGLGLIMMASDMDDNLPSKDGWQSKIEPYLKNNALFQGFEYTPPTNLNMGQIPSPATTVMGYVEGMDGRAVVYSDGHAKWLPNP